MHNAGTWNEVAMKTPILRFAGACAIAAAALAYSHDAANAKSYTTKSCSSTLITGVAKGKQYQQAQVIAKAKDNWMALTGASWPYSVDKSTSCEPWHAGLVQCFAKARPCKKIKQQMPKAHVPRPNLGPPPGLFSRGSNSFAINPLGPLHGGSGVRLRRR